jgi:hypothetical protein
MKISFVAPFFHHESVVAYTDTVGDALVHHTETVECDVDMTIVRHSKVVLVVVHSSYEEVSCDTVTVVVVVGILDVVVVRTLQFPTPGMGIPPYVDPVVVVVAMHHVMVDTEQGIHGGHDHILDGNDNNEMNLWSFPKIHNYQNYFVLRRPPVMQWVVGRMVVPTIPIDYHIPTDMYQVAGDHSSHFLFPDHVVVSFHRVVHTAHDPRMHRTEDCSVHDVVDEMLLRMRMTMMAVVRNVSFQWV